MSEVKRAIDIVGKTGLTPDQVTDYMVEVELVGKDSSEIFRRVRETLERIGLTSISEDKVLYQSCHIVHKKGRYYIAHFKTLFVLDSRENRLAPADIARQNRVINILSSWGMIKVIRPEQLEGCEGAAAGLKIIRHDERDQWDLRPKYRIGAGRGNQKQEAKEAA